MSAILMFCLVTSLSSVATTKVIFIKDLSFKNEKVVSPKTIEVKADVLSFDFELIKSDHAARLDSTLEHNAFVVHKVSDTLNAILPNKIKLNKVWRCSDTVIHNYNTKHEYLKNKKITLPVYKSPQRC